MAYLLLLLEKENILSDNMKQIYFYILISIILTGLAVISIKKNQNPTSLRSDKRNFSITDTLAIDKIVLKNRNLEKIKLERGKKSNHWILNDTLIANQYAVNLLLRTIKDMRIKNPIARTALENVIKRMAIQHVKVDVFENRKLKKRIYIGGETPDQLGTFMMIKGAQEPYVLHIPGFHGYLSSRFSCKEHLWKNKQIFNWKIKKAEYSFFETKETNKTSSKKIEFDTSRLSNIHCEAFLINNNNFNGDEIKKRKPFMSIEIITSTGDIQYFYCIRKTSVNKEKYKHQKYDQERFYGLMNNDLMLIQYKQFQNFIDLESITHKFVPWLENDSIL